METARPVSVQIIACDTPLAIARASAEPFSAIESNTSSMPLTVPTRPSSGDSGTSTRSKGRPAFIAEFTREISVLRIWRAHHERWSGRPFQVSSAACTCAGSTLRKYHARSITSVHITKPHRKIQPTNGPPSAIRSVTAAIGQSSWSAIDSSTARDLLRVARALEALGEDSRALLVEDLHDLARQRREAGVREQERVRDADPEDRRDHRLADAVRPAARNARARLGDALEGDGHAD